MNSGALKIERGVHETHGPHQREESGLDMDAINGIDFLNPVEDFQAAMRQAQHPPTR